MQIQHQPQRLRENFPVASKLLPERCREPALIFYDFLRAMDDLADDPTREPEARRAALLAVRRALEAGQYAALSPWAARYGKACAQGRLPPDCGGQLMRAFVQDTEKTRYENWEELLDYCALSAAPVGRCLLWLCDERKADLCAADALCSALQVLNHLQDARADYETLDRIYLPQAWLRRYGVSEADLRAGAMSEGLRGVYDETLAQVHGLLEQAAGLMPSIADRRMRLETGWINACARALARELAQRDPFASPVRLSRLRRLRALVAALVWLRVRQR